MLCQEKQELQRACATAWENYDAAVQAAGSAMDYTSGIPIPPKLHEALKSFVDMSRRSGYMIDPETGKSVPALTGAIRLRLEHLKASQALSKHLSNHRC
jgi:hypothetical protein